MTLAIVEFESKLSATIETYEAALNLALHNIAFWVTEYPLTVPQARREGKKQTGNNNSILGTEELFLKVLLELLTCPYILASF